MLFADKNMSDIDVPLWQRPPIVTRAFTAQCGADWTWRQDSDVFSGFNLWLILEGRGRIVSAGQTYGFTAGDCFLLRMWESQDAVHDIDNMITVPYVLFDYMDAEGRSICRGWNLPPLHYRIRNLPAFAFLMDRVIGAFLEEKQEEASQWLQTALLDLERHVPLERSALESEQMHRIDELCRSIHRAPGMRVTIGDMAARCHYSRDHFIRVFKKLRGVTPGEFLIRTRLQQADSLLLFSNQSIVSIAETLGYPDEFTFSHQFKQRRGLSPANYRKNLLGS